MIERKDNCCVVGREGCGSRVLVSRGNTGILNDRISHTHMCVEFLVYITEVSYSASIQPSLTLFKALLHYTDFRTIYLMDISLTLTISLVPISVGPKQQRIKPRNKHLL